MTEAKITVVAVQDFDASQAEHILTQECMTNVPAPSTQLPFCKGQCFEVLDRDVKWWLLVRCAESQKEGFIPSICVVPLKDNLDDKKLRSLKSGSEVESLMINTQMDLTFFPNAPCESMGKSTRKPCPEGTANIFSRFTFWWLNSLIITGFKRPLLDSDLWSLEEKNSSPYIVPRLQHEWSKEVKKSQRKEKPLYTQDPDAENTHLQGADPPVTFARKKSYEPSLPRSMMRVFAPFFVIGTMFKLFNDILVFVYPYLLGLLIDYTEDKDNEADEWKGYLYVGCMVVLTILQMTAAQHSLHISFTTAMRVNTAIAGAVYAKALSLSNVSRRLSTAGEILNLVAVDAQRVMQLTQSLNHLWSAPFQVCVAMYFLYVTMGVSMLAGTGVLILLIPLNLLITRIIRKMQVKQMKYSDERIKLMNEVLSGIKVLKLYAWEESFIKKITSIRSKELRHLVHGMYLHAAVSFTFICSPFLVSLATFAVYVMLGNELTAKKAFVAISLFNILRFPLSMLPRVVVNYVQAQVSFHRLEEFLKLDDVRSDNVIHSLPSQCLSQVVHIEDGSFCWDKTEGTVILRNINLSVASGSLVAVVGQVGCGKSTLLSALLGETEKVAGKVYVKGSTAYVPQQAWIQNATLQENVLFNLPRDRDRYKHVVSACALDPDIEVLPAGDLTEIGEKGINLSGGQKQRVSLARAVYFDADIYLLDDPLSAVDSHVGKHIFDKVIGPEGMLKKKTRVLVTHAVKFLPHMDQIIVLQDGKISEVGTYAELKAAQGSFAEFLETYASENGCHDSNSRVKPRKDNPKSPDAPSNQSKRPTVNRSVSCHFHGNELHPRNHVLKSHSDVNLARLVVDKHWQSKDAGKLSPLKKLQKSEKYNSVASMHSVNSLLSMCEGMEADFLVEDESLLDNEDKEDEEIPVALQPKLPRPQSVASDLSVNSLLSLLGEVEEESVSKPGTVSAKEHQEEVISDGETKSLRDNGPSRTSAESPVEKKERRRRRKKEGRTTSDEKSQSGRVKFSVVTTYACALGIFCSIVILLCGLGAESSLVASRIWLAKWSSTNVTSSQQRDLFLGIYAALGFGQGLLMTGLAFVLAYSAMKAARNLHSGLLINIMHLPMTFFETTPLGRIVNRFARDMSSVDDKIPRALQVFLRTLLSVLGTIVVISYSTPLFLTCVLPLGVLYVFIQRVFVATSRQLRRIESVSRSPIYNHFFESINGTSTIRAYSQQDRFIAESYRRVDENQAAHYPGISANRWLAIRLEIIGTSILFFASLFSVIARDTIAPGLVGLSIAYALQITSTLNWLVRQSSELESNIVAVERIKEYTLITREADWIIPSHRPPEDWPPQGRVEMQHFDLRYREQLPLVLSDVNCIIGVGEKIGIVGRTGAGKSSLALALFRILERAGGRILIDSVDIATIGLQDLRSRLTIIPQDPVLFSGDLRLNLDPFENNTDDELWSVLEVSHLKNFVSGLEKGLRHPIAEGGENLSVGQRQLVCLARALLRKSQILVLDEATAAVDLETDELIQQTIRREFAGRTVLIIAHRLNTIMDCDRIMVLQTGSVVEFDTPARLLAKKELFYGMARDAGLA